jgi:hypothetical protein
MLGQLAVVTFAVLTFGFAAAGSARADEVVFSNFGPAMTYSNLGYPITGSNAPQALAVQFASTGDFTFTQVRLPMQLLEGTNSLTIVLATESGSGSPGLLLESITLNDAMTELPGGGIVFASSTLHPLLQAGTSYWLVVFAPVGDTTALWLTSDGDLSDGGNFVASFNADADGSWFQEPPFAPRPAFEISGSGAATVPEPATLGLLGAGLAGAGAVARRRRRRQR